MIVVLPVAESTSSTWAKVRLRMRHRTPAHAPSSYASGSARQAGRTMATRSPGASA